MSVQVNGLIMCSPGTDSVPPGCGHGLESDPVTVIRSPGCFGRVAEWQTRWLQVPVSFGTWGLKSPFAHKRAVLRTAGIKVTNSKEVVTFVFWGDEAAR